MAKRLIYIFIVGVYVSREIAKKFCTLAANWLPAGWYAWQPRANRQDSSSRTSCRACQDQRTRARVLGIAWK
jgi:hypothetical protein